MEAVKSNGQPGATAVCKRSSESDILRERNRTPCTMTALPLCCTKDVRSCPPRTPQTYSWLNGRLKLATGTHIDICAPHFFQLPTPNLSNPVALRDAGV